MKNQVCCFTGHRPKALPWKYNETDPRCKDLKLSIRCTVENLIVNDGYKRFISGMALGTDIICAEIVLELKMKYPFIALECAIPNRSFATKWARDQIDRYLQITRRADKITYVSDSVAYEIADLMKRNIYMVDTSDLIIAVYTMGSTGGTQNTLKYALEHGKQIILIEPERNII
ncbi:hypothetical protein FACS1894105_00990 [Clostridia bacterium]|nr:hypothetical protein FACS1894105_00990 [Clostridia bacterium]GHV13557.1 hypothetical protein FACS1894219_08550 [Clostridia bacterium]